MSRASRRHWIGGKSPAPRVRGRALAVNQVAHLSALERDLERACARYERAVRALDERAQELEQPPSAEELVARAMQEATAAENGFAAPLDERPRLSAVGFGELRSLGLSVTQAKRVLSLRDRGVLKSTAGLDSVPGLPTRLVAKLRRVLQD